MSLGFLRFNIRTTSAIFLKNDAEPTYPVSKCV